MHSRTLTNKEQYNICDVLLNEENSFVAAINLIESTFFAYVNAHSPREGTQEK